MPRCTLRYSACCILLLNVLGRAAADEPRAPRLPQKPVPAAPPAKTVEQLVEAARKSVVVITYEGRDGKREGLGTGFVVGADGLIATNLHVLGEARPITVQLPDGQRYPVTSVHASDRTLDLALVRIDARGLTPLQLGDSDRLKAGQAVVALGNPLGLANSVVSGVVSARREIDGRPMIQLAIPIEAGNSGGPLLDLEGRVQGLLTLKSAITANLGFAVPINLLRPLLKKPNPIPMARWRTLGTLDPAEWQVVFAARWKRRAGRMVAEGFGSGFGGRSLCLWQGRLPPLPYEVAVTVRLEDEAGAAGLVFHADGRDRHYGFYPSAGQLRLTRFDGPDVFSWTILRQQPSPFYRPGDWNTLKVRLERDRIRCYVNNHLVVESTDTGLSGGRVGLAKFRDTRAEFKDFRVAREIPTPALPAALVGQITRWLDGLAPPAAPDAALVDRLVPEAASGAVLRERARRLEEEAAGLRDLAAAVHQKRVQAELVKVLTPKEEAIDLLHAALLVAKLDNEDLDIAVYRREVDRLARELRAGLPRGADDKAKVAALNRYLFDLQGFHGSRTDYYNRANCYLNEVLDDREGLPITLSVLYLELARRLGVKMIGISLPGHFLVEQVPARGEPQLIDVFEGGKPVTRAEARAKVRAITGQAPTAKDFAPAGSKAIILRILHNLLGIARDEGHLKGCLRYLDAMLAVEPGAGEERLLRAAARFQGGDRQGALADVDWLLAHRPKGVSVDRVQELRRLLARPEP